MKVVLSRAYHQTSTTGKMVVFDGDKLLLSVCTIEPPDNGNQVNVSCIPEGVYTVKKIYSPKFGKCFWVQDVNGRSEILLHRGNYSKDTRGCIIPGMAFYDLDSDGVTDVIESTRAMSRLLEILPDEFKLWII